MNWLIYAFTGPVFWAASTHMDKYLVERYFKHSDVGVLLVFTALIGLVMLPFILYWQPAVLALAWQDILVIAFSGVLYMAAMYFYLQALQTDEASVVAPFFQAGPLFAYALAYLVLGETLTRIQLRAAHLSWVAGCCSPCIRPVAACGCAWCCSCSPAPSSWR